MKFSVIIPIYKVEAYLNECVDSVLRQTYKDYELILVDDGSPDRCPEICDEYAEKYDFIRAVHKPNGGLSDARNAGTAVAKGDYIVYIDSDDYLADDIFLEKLAQKTENDPDIIIYKFKKYYEDTKRFEECTYSMNDITEGENIADIINKLASSDSFYCSAWSKSIKRSIINDNNIIFKKGILGEDIEWYYRVMFYVKKIAILDEIGIVYRQREGSIAQTGGEKNFIDNITTLKYWEDHLKEYPDTDVRNALYNSMGKLVSNLMISYSRAGAWRKEHKSKLKKLMYIVKNSTNPRARSIAKFYKLIGFNATVIALRALDKMKH